MYIYIYVCVSIFWGVVLDLYFRFNVHSAGMDQNPLLLFLDHILGMNVHFPTMVSTLSHVRFLGASYVYGPVFGTCDKPQS